MTTTTSHDSLTAAGADGPARAMAATETTSATDAAIRGSSAGASSDTSSNAGLSDEERLLEFAQCMRDNGVDFPDPVVEADGTIVFGRRPGGAGGGQDGQGVEAIGRDPDLPAARAACSDLIEGLALGPGGRNFDEARVELMDRLLEFAQCMRDNGVDVGDPDPNAFTPGGGGGRPFGGLDFDDSDVSAALEICGEQLPVRPGRGGGQ
ncbi:hypothetical protein [Candidatus Poriferisodalis sp.]|uniref:hypothetical protein n=1 Tax=Candidatus Poriferisodalis sp. TaxID=3101277 RepID=UPI003B0231D0